jgi:peptidoglycan L-alanyl-D-glutamate endopeptidase CwlK
MPSFGARSLANLATADKRLQDLFNDVVKVWDCSVTEGHRGQAEQHAAFVAGNSKLDWPNGNHNALPSNAVDVYPYPIDMNNKEEFYYFAGFVMGMAQARGLKLRWGGDWNQNKRVEDNTFNDLVHFELTDNLNKPPVQ